MIVWLGNATPRLRPKNLFSSTFFNKLDLKQHFLINDKASLDIKPYDWKISCFNEFMEVFLDTRLMPWCVNIIAVKTNFVLTYLIYILATNYMISLELHIIYIYIYLYMYMKFLSITECTLFKTASRTRMANCKNWTLSSTFQLWEQ